MIKLPKQLMVLLGTLLIVASQGLADVFEHPINESSKKEVAAIEKSLTKEPLIKGAFTQARHIEGLQKSFVSSGDFIFYKNKGVYWNITSPLEATFVFSEQGTLQIIDGEEKFTKAADQPFYNNLSDLFKALQAGELYSLEQAFNLYYAGEQAAWTIGLKAKEEMVKKAMAEVVMSGGKKISSVKIKDAKNNTMLIKFSKIKVLDKLTPNEAKYFNI